MIDATVLPNLPFLEYEEGETGDAIEYGEKEGEMPYKILGSVIEDHELMVFVCWDESEEVVTKHPISDAWTDLKDTTFYEQNKTPHIQKWMEWKQRELDKVEEESKQCNERQQKEMALCQQELENKSKICHYELLDLDLVDDPVYCEENQYLHGVSCALCSVAFVKVLVDELSETLVSPTKPVRCCHNCTIKTHECTYAICIGYFLKEPDKKLWHRRG